MKKLGFTLAEVLITLGIIGVVASLTAPALINDVTERKVGPALQKAKTTFETAAEMVLMDSQLPRLTNVASNNVQLGNALARYMKIYHKNDKYTLYSYWDKTVPMDSVPNAHGAGWNGAGNPYDIYMSEEGFAYWIWLSNPNGQQIEGMPETPSNELIGSILVDINGEKGPNQIAKDCFSFRLFNDGTLRPSGSSYFAENAAGTSGTWKNGNCDETHVNAPNTCTGSIFENGLKIIYQ